VELKKVVALNKIDISESSAELLAEAIAQKLGRK
jgi:hypothetical protein